MLETRLEDVIVSQRRKFDHAMKKLKTAWDGRQNANSQEHLLGNMQALLVEAHDAVSGLRFALKLRSNPVGRKTCGAATVMGGVFCWGHAKAAIVKEAEKMKKDGTGTMMWSPAPDAKEDG